MDSHGRRDREPAHEPRTVGRLGQHGCAVSAGHDIALWSAAPHSDASADQGLSIMRNIVLTLLLTAGSTAGAAAQQATTTPPPTHQESDVPEGFLPEPAIVGRAVGLEAVISEARRCPGRTGSIQTWMAWPRAPDLPRTWRSPAFFSIAACSSTGRPDCGGCTSRRRDASSCLASRRITSRWALHTQWQDLDR